MDGIILVDKPQKFTSHDLVKTIRKILNTRKVGHFGTLDPMATGLMINAVGKATKLFSFFSKADKVYQGGIRFGYATDTYDSFGKPVSSEQKNYPDKIKLLETIKSFTGEINQVPPPYSAKKYKGRPLYKYARDKKEIRLKSNKLFIHYFRLINYTPPLLKFEVKCSSGTYIRSLAHDLGRDLKCGAHLSVLSRLEIGNFHLKKCFTIQEIKKLFEEGKMTKFLIPLESLLPEFPKIILDNAGAILAKNGNPISHHYILKVFNQDNTSSCFTFEKEKTFRMFTVEGKLIAFARQSPEKNHFHPFLVINSENDKK
ncbi:tRNA pseudouridine(55) synthase TruB [Acidobacteriota bacterium]